MIERSDDNEFVYPISYEESGEPGHAHVDHGISKRDWFAAMAMQGMVVGSKSSSESMHPTTALEVARTAYHYADIMLRVAKEPVRIGGEDK